MNPPAEGVGFASTSSSVQGPDGRQVAEGEPQHGFTGDDHLLYWEDNLGEAHGYVYVIQGEPGTPIKVGFAVDVRARIASLQTGNWDRLRLLYVVPTKAHEGLEWQLHQRLRDARVGGEWFALPAAPDFLEWFAGFAEFMVTTHRETKALPPFRDFEGEWYMRQRGKPHVTVRRMEPSPVDPDDAAQRLAAAWMRPGRVGSPLAASRNTGTIN